MPCFVTDFQRSIGGGGTLQRKTEELEAQVKKLEEEKAGLKQDNASLVSSLLYLEIPCRLESSPAVSEEVGAVGLHVI